MKSSPLLGIAITIITTYAAPTTETLHYLSLSEQFSEWDQVSAISTELIADSNTTTPFDSALAVYYPFFQEWDLITDYENHHDWNSLVELLEIDGEKYVGSFGEWDRSSYLASKHHARSYNIWQKINPGVRFDTAQVRPWNPELAPSHVTPLSPLSISPSPNPTWTGFVDFPLNLNAKVWSNRLALTPYVDLFQNPNDDVWSRFITQTIKNTFSLSDRDTPEESRDKMRRALKRDVRVNSLVSYAPFAISGERGNFGLTVSTESGITIPGDLLGIIFGSSLEAGTSLDISSLQAQSSVTASVAIGGRSQRPAPAFLTPLLPTGEGLLWKQVNVDIITGFAFAEVAGKKGVMAINGEGTSYQFDGEAEVNLAGVGAKEMYQFSNPFESGYSPAGYGLGVDVGFELADERRVFQLQVANLGAMRWHSVQTGKASIHSNQIDIEAMVNGGEPEVLLTTSVDTLREIKSLWRPINTSMTVAASQVISRFGKRSAHGLYSRQLRAFAEYNQMLTPSAGGSFIPKLRGGIDNDFLMGLIGMGYFASVGGSERLSSGLTLRLFQNRKYTIHTEYSAFGSAILFPKRGMGLSLVTRFNRKPERWYR